MSHKWPLSHSNFFSRINLKFNVSSSWPQRRSDGSWLMTGKLESWWKAAVIVNNVNISKHQTPSSLIANLWVDGGHLGPSSTLWFMTKSCLILWGIPFQYFNMVISWWFNTFVYLLKFIIFPCFYLTLTTDILQKYDLNVWFLCLVYYINNIFSICTLEAQSDWCIGWQQ